MSFYNLLYGVGPATWYILPMLGKHPDEYPRFRDCFIGDDENSIEVLTRVGGNNRNLGFGEEELEKHPNFLRTYDWGEDNTYGIYVFSVPEKWKEDFERIKASKYEEVSDEYINEICRVYPKLEENLRKQFRKVREKRAAECGK